MTGKTISYSIEVIKPDRRPAIWVMREPNHLLPVCYLQRPKWLSDAQWDAVIDAIRLDARTDFLEMQP